MNRKFFRTALVATAMFAAGLVSLSAANAPQGYEAMSSKLVTALETGTFEQFIADGDASWKKLQKSQFDGISGQLAPRLKSGYTLGYLGELTLRGAQLTLWKITFKSGGDELFVTMGVKDGKVRSFGLPRI